MKDKLGRCIQRCNEVQGSKKQYDMMSDPINLNKEAKNKVPNYGTGLTPYFLSLGLFVGGLLLTVLLSSS